MPDSKRILIVRPGALGDLVLTLPAIMRIRSENPSARITIAGNVEFLPLIRDTVNTITSFESPVLRPLFLAPDRSFRDSASLAYVWLRNPEDVFVQNLRQSGLEVKFAPSFQTMESVHQSDFLYGIHGDSLPAPEPRLALGQLSRNRFVEKAGLPKRPRIAVHAGAGSPRKRWPIERFMQLARVLGSENDIYWIVGPADTAQESLGHVVHTDIVKLAYFLETMDLFIGNDSGVTHLARALDVTTVALFGPTNPEVWSPRGAHVLHARGPDDRPDSQVKDVLDLVSGLLSMKAHDTHC
ncbi:MAG: glycosyltransferase family 9 protein [Spirochaetia bacterium]|nr:glycosyltransferase family 9 protein [Spirochaetia bacterium]